MCVSLCHPFGYLSKCLSYLIQNAYVLYPCFCHSVRQVFAMRYEFQIQFFFSLICYVFL